MIKPKEGDRVLQCPTCKEVFSEHIGDFYTVKRYGECGVCLMKKGKDNED